MHREIRDRQHSSFSESTATVGCRLGHEIIITTKSIDLRWGKSMRVVRLVDGLPFYCARNAHPYRKWQQQQQQLPCQITRTRERSSCQSDQKSSDSDDISRFSSTWAVKNEVIPSHKVVSRANFYLRVCVKLVSTAAGLAQPFRDEN